MKTKSVIKPCPFCGEEGSVHMFKDRKDYAVVCDFNLGGCGACGGYRETSNDAAEAWNKRVKDKRVEGEQTEMNYIPKVAEMLGVKIGQEFICHWNTVQFGKPYTNRQKGVLRFAKTRLEINTNGYWDLCGLLQEIIQGDLIITEVEENELNTNDL